MAAKASAGYGRQEGSQGKRANLRDFGCDFGKFWETRRRREEADRIVRDQCWCTHVCFIHDRLRYSSRALLYDIPVTYREAEFSNGSSSGKEPSPAAARRSTSS